MRVGIGTIREVRGGFVPFEGIQNIAASELEWGLKIVNPVSVKGTVTNTGEGFLVQGKIEFGYEAVCDRCLETVTGIQTVEVSEEFVENYPTGEDDRVIGFSGDFIDLTDYINEQIWLAVPMKLLCKPDCHGICQSCGVNLNNGECLCSSERINPQFEKLKNLLSTEGGGSNGKSKE